LKGSRCPKGGGVNSANSKFLAIIKPYT
jgi:hypothetical protein